MYNGQAQAYSAAFSAGLFAASGGGAESKNSIQTTTNATVLSSSITATGDVLVSADEASLATSYVGTLSAALGLVSIAAGGSVSTVLSSPTVNSSISASTVSADEISVLSSSTPRGSLSSLGVNAGSLAIGVSKSELTFQPNLVSTIGGTIRSRNLTVNSELRNLAGQRAGAVTTTAGAGGLIGVDATISRISVGGSISSGIANNANLIVSGDASVSALGSGVYYSNASSNAYGILAAGISSSAIGAAVTVNANVGSFVSHSGGTFSVNG